MAPILYGHPFSSYTQKALIALYENATPFDYRVLGPDPAIGAEFAALWPVKRFPILVDKGHTILEASTVIEYLGLHYPGEVELVPRDAKAALEVRMMDRIFDNYIMTPMQKHVFNALRPEADRDAYGVNEAKTLLEAAYGWLNKVLEGREWAAGGGFSLADCAAAPSLFFADWVHEIGGDYPHLRAYRARVLARPSVARAVDEARPFRPYFPLGAPQRD